MRIRAALTVYTIVSAIMLAGCPSPTPQQPALLGTLTLSKAPEALALDVTRGRGYVTDGARVRALDLATRQFLADPGGTGQFMALDPLDDMYGVLSAETGQALNVIAYGTNQTNAGHALGMTYDPTSHSLYVVDNFSLGGATTLFRVNLDTFERTAIGEAGLGNGLRIAYCLARDPATGLLYTMDPEDYLWRINVGTATAQKVGHVDAFADIQGLSFSPSGELYGMHNDNPCSVVQLDKATAAATYFVALPLSYAASTLAFKPDGTLWAVDLVRDSLIEIDISTGAIATEFPPLPVLRPSAVGTYLEDVHGLTFIPDGVPGGYLTSQSDPDALAVLGDGGVLASSASHMTRMTMNLAHVGSVSVDGLEQFEPIVPNPVTGLVYTKGGLSGTVFEIDPSDMSVVREIQLREARDNLPSTFTPHMDIDPQTNRLFVRDPEGLFVVDLDETGKSLVETVPLDFVPEGVVVDPVRRILIVNQLYGSTPHASIQILNIDTYALIAERGLGNQIHWIALDAARGRIAANVRVTTSFTTEVKLLSLPNLTPVEFGLKIEGEQEWGSLYALLAVDPSGNQLAVAREGGPPRIDFYQLP
jgi:DNA-binding beta-propeller fold protein YncE